MRLRDPTATVGVVGVQKLKKYRMGSEGRISGLVVFVPGSGGLAYPEDGTPLHGQGSCLKRGYLGCYRCVVGFEDEVEKSGAVQGVGVEGRIVRGRGRCERYAYSEREVEELAKGNGIRLVENVLTDSFPWG